MDPLLLGLLVAVPGKGASLDVAELGALMKGTLARFKQPKAIFVVDELPRNTMGKVQKNLLRDAYRDHFG